jgi:CubicO group peptidase (beta-lactamase class C family)
MYAHRLSSVSTWLRSAHLHWVSAATLLVHLLATPLLAYDFTALSELAQGAVSGENVAVPVPGFEIRVLQHGTPIFHQAFGDWSLDRPANADSGTKTFSGALIMSLVDSSDSGFTLDSRLADFLPEYGEPQLSEITIRQSFSHQSGFAGEQILSPILLNPSITLREAAAQISQLPLVHGPPGSTFAYGGLSMQAAGAAAEVATHMTYTELFGERITLPLGMANTRFVNASDANPRVAGGVESTATDFSRFMDMLLNGGVDRTSSTTVLTADSVEEMLRRQTTDELMIANTPTGNNRYGIGVWLDQLGQAGPVVDVLAAGARGFHSWIDKSAGLVFTCATDLTSFNNVEMLSSMMHNEILRTIAGAGDYDGNGTIDEQDLIEWRRSFGSTVAPFASGDGNGDGVVDAADYIVWRNGVAISPPSTATALPEPTGPATAAALFFLGFCLPAERFRPR